MRKHKVTVDDPETVDFEAFVDWVGKNTETEESIRELDKEDAKGVQRKQDLKELVEDVRVPMVVTKEQKKATPMTDPIEAITQRFKQLSIDLVSAMNKTLGGSQGGFQAQSQGPSARYQTILQRPPPLQSNQLTQALPPSLAASSTVNALRASFLNNDKCFYC